MVRLLGSEFNVEIWSDCWGQFLMLKYGPTFGDQNLTGVTFSRECQFVLRMIGSLINSPGLFRMLQIDQLSVKN